MKFEYWLSNIYIDNTKKINLKRSGIDAKTLFYMKNDELEKLQILTGKDIEKIDRSRQTWDIEKKWEDFVLTGINFTSIGMEDYPQKLAEIPDSPYALYYIGKLPDESQKAVAIVGARMRSAYGCEVAKKIAQKLAQNDISVISGMARGIDRDGHVGALEENGLTYAVLGSGVDICYPKENKFLYEKIPHSGGLISENPPGTMAAARNFPLRNRIISGLCDKVVVVEAKDKSGSLITADYAMEQGKDVYVVPGRITDPLSRGCNRLIKQGAGIIYDIDDFIADITLTVFKECVQMDFRKNVLDKKSLLVYSLLDFSPIGLGELLEKVPYGLSELIEIIEYLKHIGFIKECITNYYIKTL